MTTTNFRRSRYAASVVTKNELLELLNADFNRECKAIYAHAVFAERLRGDAAVAARVTAQGHETVRAALVLCQLVYDYGGTVRDEVDELNAVLNADRVARPDRHDETLRRLHERAGQLRAAGEPGLAKRLRRLITGKRSAASLADLARGAGRGD